MNETTNFIWNVPFLDGLFYFPFQVNFIRPEIFMRMFLFVIYGSQDDGLIIIKLLYLLYLFSLEPIEYHNTEKTKKAGRIRIVI